MNAKRRRVKAYVDALSELILNDNPSREHAIELVKEKLEAERVEPFRGASKPDDIYEKELISLYIVATRGLGVRDDYPDLFKKVFEREAKYEMVLNILESGMPSDRAREAILNIFPGLQGTEIARILRFAVTLYYLDFKPYTYVINVIKGMLKAFPEFGDTIRRFTKFFIAVKLSEEIASGSVRNRIDKEVRKQLISIETGIPKTTPSDSYVVKVARAVYEVPKGVIESVFEG
mgnify:CR=1 FL=1